MHNTWWGFEPLPIRAFPIAKQMTYTSKTHIGHSHTNQNVNHVHSQVCCHLVNVVYKHKHNKLTKVDFSKTNKQKISKDLNVHVHDPKASITCLVMKVKTYCKKILTT
jgi:hypothetical protein